MSSILSDPQILESASPTPIEEEVQHLFGLLGQVSPEARTQFIAQLLQGVASKINNTLSGDILKLSQNQTGKSGIKGSTNTSSRSKKPEPWPGAGRLELFEPLDPIEGWNHFGPDAYYRILYYETLPILESILIHTNMPVGQRPKGKATSTNLAKNIIERLEKHFITK